MALFETRKDYSVVKDYVKYVKHVEKVASMEKEYNELKDSLGQDSPFVIVAKSKLDEAKQDEIMAVGPYYEALTEDEKDLITLAMGRFTKKLENSLDFEKEVENCVSRLQSNTVDASTVKRLCKAAGDVMGKKVKPYRGVNETILEGFKASRYTGLKLGKYDPVKFAKRTSKQWEAQLALYLYASIQES